MADIKTLAESRGTLVNFDPRKLKVKQGLNARDFTDPASIEHVETICASIMARGFLNSRPLEIFSEGGDVFVSDGECRLRASMLAIERGLDLRTVPCVPEARGTSDAERFLNQNLSNGGRNLTLAEQGLNIKRAQSLGVPLDEIAKKLGRSVTYATHALDFMAAPAEVHKLVKEGKVSSTLAARVVRRDGPERGAKKLRSAVEKAAERGSTKARPRDVEKPDKRTALDLVRAIAEASGQLAKSIKDDELVTIDVRARVLREIWEMVK